MCVLSFFAKPVVPCFSYPCSAAVCSEYVFFFFGTGFIPKSFCGWSPTVDWDVMQSNSCAMDCLLPMGVTSENVVEEYGLKRRKLDEFSVLSHQKGSSYSKKKKGKFDQEIVPVGDVSKDDGVRPSSNITTLSKTKGSVQGKWSNDGW